MTKRAFAIGVALLLSVAGSVSAQTAGFTACMNMVGIESLTVPDPDAAGQTVVIRLRIANRTANAMNVPWTLAIRSVSTSYVVRAVNTTTGTASVPAKSTTEVIKYWTFDDASYEITGSITPSMTSECSSDNTKTIPAGIYWAECTQSAAFVRGGTLDGSYGLLIDANQTVDTCRQRYDPTCSSGTLTRFSGQDLCVTTSAGTNPTCATGLGYAVDAFRTDTGPYDFCLAPTNVAVLCPAGYSQVALTGRDRCRLIQPPR